MCPYALFSLGQSHILQSTVHLFADDCLMYRTINSPGDHQMLQEDLNTLSNWATIWQMKFNINKCCILRHHHKETFPYHMSNKPLKVVKQHPYLGIIIDHHPSCGPQVNHVCNKATRLIGFLQCNLQNCPQVLKELSFNCLY